jgi:hypothetical protein
MVEKSDSQTENLWRISGLDAVALGLSCVPSNNTEVRPSDGEDSPAVLAVGVELPLLGYAMCVRGSVGQDKSHVEKEESFWWGERNQVGKALSLQ